MIEAGAVGEDRAESGDGMEGRIGERRAAEGAGAPDLDGGAAREAGFCAEADILETDGAGTRAGGSSACSAGSASSTGAADFDFFPDFAGSALDLEERPVDLGGMSGRKGLMAGAGGGGDGGSSPSSLDSRACSALSSAPPSSGDGSMAAIFGSLTADFFAARGWIDGTPAGGRVAKRESGWA
jgi:hypothetical protein